MCSLVGSCKNPHEKDEDALLVDCLLRLFLSPISKTVTKRGHNAQSTSDNIPKRHGDKIFGDELHERDIGSAEHSKRDDKHISDRMVESESNERRDWEPNSNHFPGQSGRSRGHINGHTDQPITQDTTNEGNIPSEAALSGSNGRRSRRRPKTAK